MQNELQRYKKNRILNKKVERKRVKKSKERNEVTKDTEEFN